MVAFLQKNWSKCWIKISRSNSRWLKCYKFSSDNKVILDGAPNFLSQYQVCVNIILINLIIHLTGANNGSDVLRSWAGWWRRNPGESRIRRTPPDWPDPVRSVSPLETGRLPVHHQFRRTNRSRSGHDVARNQRAMSQHNFQWRRKRKKNVSHENYGNCKKSFPFLHSFKNFNEKIFDLFMLEFVIQNFKI